MYCYGSPERSPRIYALYLAVALRWPGLVSNLGIIVNVSVLVMKTVVVVVRRSSWRRRWWTRKGTGIVTRSGSQCRYGPRSLPRFYYRLYVLGQGTTVGACEPAFEEALGPMAFWFSRKLKFPMVCRFNVSRTSVVRSCVTALMRTLYHCSSTMQSMGHRAAKWTHPLNPKRTHKP